MRSRMFLNSVEVCVFLMFVTSIALLGLAIIEIIPECIDAFNRMVVGAMDVNTIIPDLYMVGGGICLFTLGLLVEHFYLVKRLPNEERVILKRK